MYDDALPWGQSSAVATDTVPRTVIATSEPLPATVSAPRSEPGSLLPDDILGVNEATKSLDVAAMEPSASTPSADDEAYNRELWFRMLAGEPAQSDDALPIEPVQDDMAAPELPISEQELPDAGEVAQSEDDSSCDQAPADLEAPAPPACAEEPTEMAETPQSEDLPAPVYLQVESVEPTLPADEEPIDAADTVLSVDGNAVALVGRLVAEGKMEVFRGSEGLPYALVPEGNSRALVSLEARGRALRHSLNHIIYAGTGQLAAGASLSQAVELALSMAARAADVRPVYRRLGTANDNVYLDLGRTDRQIVEVVPGQGWRLTTSSPVCFHRAPAMRAQPFPATALEEGLRPLWRLFGGRVAEDDKILLTGWLVGAMQPDAPYPILALYGEHGSTKSTIARMLMSLLDPAGANGHGLLPRPKNDSDLGAFAFDRHVLAFDNLSSLPVWLSDSLARLSTGGSFPRRGSSAEGGSGMSYFRRPIIINGMCDLAERSDLLDRTIAVHVVPFTGDRLTEKDFWAAFEQAKPTILAGLLQAVSVALQNLPNVKGDLPRMADFAKWVVAAEAALPWVAGRFAEVYAANRAGAVETALDASPVTTVLEEFLRRSDRMGEQWMGRGKWQTTDEGWLWSGTASELLHELDLLAGGERQRPGWPKAPKALSSELRQLANGLRASGRADIAWRRANGRSLIEILCL